jgi:hypothetical protein
MTYGQWSPASEQDPVVARELARASGTWAWRQLDADLKLKLVDKALEAANDRIDAFPLAL